MPRYLRDGALDGRFGIGIPPRRTPMRYLILGSGPAGLAAAKAARKKDTDAEIVIATEENVAPYLRPMLPDLVSGERELSGIADPQGKELAQLGITFAGGEARPPGRRGEEPRRLLRRDRGDVQLPVRRHGRKADPSAFPDGGAGLVPVPQLPGRRPARAGARDAFRHDGGVRPGVPRHRGGPGAAEAGEPGRVDQSRPPPLREPHLRGRGGPGGRPAPVEGREDHGGDGNRRRGQRGREELRRG